MDIESFRTLVTDLAEDHYRFTDTEYGFSKIEKNDIIEQQHGVAVARFRLDVSDSVAIKYFVEYVCKKIGDEPRLIIERKELYGLPYLECVWVAVINKEEETIKHTNEIMDAIESRISDRIDQDFDTTQYTGDMFA